MNRKKQWISLFCVTFLLCEYSGCRHGSRLVVTARDYDWPNRRKFVSELCVPPPENITNCLAVSDNYRSFSCISLSIPNVGRYLDRLKSLSVRDPYDYRLLVARKFYRILLAQRVYTYIWCLNLEMRTFSDTCTYLVQARNTFSWYIRDQLLD